MEIEVKCFAAAREAVGAREILVDVPQGVTVKEFRDVLLDTYPGLRDLNLQVAVNMVYVVGKRSTEESAPTAVTLDTQLQPGDVVACIPPVGGG